MPTGFMHTRLAANWVTAAVGDVPSGLPLMGTTVVEVFDESDLATGDLTMSAPPVGVRILNTDTSNAGTFTVNGLDLIVPATTGLETLVAGVPSLTVTVTGSTEFVFHRLA